MEITTLVGVLDQPHLAADHLRRWGLTDIDRGRELLRELAESGLTLDLLATISGQFAEHLPGTPDPDTALAAFCRYVLAVRSPLSLAALFERDRSAMPMLLAALSLGPRWADLVAADPEAFDLLRQNEGQPVERATLLAEVLGETSTVHEGRSVTAALARLRSRHLLRIAYGEIIRRQPIAIVLDQLSLLAEALLEAAYDAAARHVREMQAAPRGSQPQQLRSCVVAVGRLGAGEPAYAGPLDLLVVYSPVAGDAQSVRAAHEHFDRVGKLFLRLFNDACGGEAGWQARLLSLPDSASAAVAHAVDDVVLGFDSFGRTWHRQALLRARPVAGDVELGAAVINRLQSWLYRRYLGRADETGIKALKRRILLDATVHQDDWRDVRQARGGLGDIERTVDFLQLLAGGEYHGVRRQSTPEAIGGLAQAGTISAAERETLERSWSTLRSCEHRLQIFINPGAACLPEDGLSLARIASALSAPQESPTDFLSQWRGQLDRSWQTLRKLLDSAFIHDSFTTREVELLLDPAPSSEEARAGLSPFGFAHPEQALANLHRLAQEHVPFLSTRHCRHLLAAILPRLLSDIAATPNPDGALDNLARISDSLGGKGVLWQLFHASPPTLHLYVKLCSASPYLADILTTNPGMLDELVDSLQLGKLPTKAELDATLAELCRVTKDTMPVLHDFKNAQHLQFGIRDLIGDEDIDLTHAALADVAEICLTHVVELEKSRLVEKFGPPTLGSGELEGQPCGLCVVGLGQLGGRSPNYHSPLDLIFLYESEGGTRPALRSKQGQRTANNHFFTQLAQAVMKQLSQLTPKGRLYAVESTLRPIGVGGSLALTHADFKQHFAGGGAPTWQWLSLCRARPVQGQAGVAAATSRLIQQLLVERPSQVADPVETRRLRLEAEKGADASNLKRGPGGTLDVEMIAQRLQLQHAAEAPGVLTPNTQDALVRLADAGLLEGDFARRLGHNYRFLRRIEAGIRLLNTPARHDLPDDPQQLAQLALLLGHSNPERLREECLEAMRENRAIFDRLMPEIE